MKVQWLMAFCLLAQFGMGQPFQPYTENYNRLVQGISFSPDGKVLYMALPHKERMVAMEQKIHPNTPRLAMYKAERDVEGKWSEPELLNFSGVYKDYDPTLSPDGKWLFFNSDRPFKSKTSSKNNIWFSGWENGQWSTPKPVGGINTLALEESYPSISLRGKLVYSKEIVTDSISEFHLHMAHFNGEKTKAGHRIRFPNFHKQTSDPWLSPKGDYLIFTGFDLNNWNTSCDLYISFFSKRKWSTPKPISELNSGGPDFSPTVSPNGAWIYYRKNYQFMQVPFKKLLETYRTK